MAITNVNSSSYQAQIDPTLDTVKVKHRLLYIEIRMGCLITECLQKARNSVISETALMSASEQYKAINLQLETSSSFLSMVDRSLESQLKALYNIRASFTTPLLKHAKTVDMHPALKSLLSQFDQLTSTIKLKGDISESERQKWEEQVDQFQEQFCLASENRKLKRFWKLAYPDIVRKAEILSLYRSWEQVLHREGEAFSELNPISSAIKIKQLLQRDKRLFFYHYFLAKETQSFALKLCCQSFQKDPNLMMASLVSEIEQLKTKIFIYEKKLLSAIGRISHVISAVVSWLTDNSYSQVGDFLIESQDKMTQTWDRVPILATPLEPPCLNCAEVMVGMGLLTIDLWQWQWSISQNLLHMISRPFTPSTETWITCFQKLGLDDKTTLLSLPTIDMFSQGTAFVTIQACSLGFSTTVLWQATLSYSLSLAAVALVGKTVDQIYIRIRGDYTTAASHPFVRGVSQMATFPLASTYFLSYFLENNVPYSGHIFENREACLANPQLCRKKGCQMLGLPETPSESEIKKVFHQLAKQYHPDHNPSGSTQYMRITAAKDACLNLKKS